MLKKAFQLIGVLLIISSPLSGQDSFEQSGYYRLPVQTPYGIIATDNYQSSLTLFQQSTATLLQHSPGCGNGFTVNAGRTIVGIKHIDKQGRQYPAIITLADGKMIPLNEPVSRCGQVSFSDNGTIAFTIGDSVVIIQPGGALARHYLGNYANTAPIAPDARYIAFNNAEDKLYLYELATGRQIGITNSEGAYFAPVWAPDSRALCYASMDGRLFLYNLQTNATVALGTGERPVWIDTENIVFSRKQADGMQFTGAELYTANLSGTVSAITSTKDIDEIDPSYDPVSGTLLCASVRDRSLYQVEISGMQHAAYRKMAEMKEAVTPAPAPDALKNSTAMEIPYVHQVYDTPNWFNGHSACGPTTAIMALAFYNILPKWEGICSTPYQHYNYFGRYVSDKYNFQQLGYYYTAKDPNNTSSYGGFGYMWSTGSPHTRMAGYFINHGLSSQTTDNPSLQTIINEIGRGYPYAFCVGLTTSGHIVLVHGVGAEQHTLVVNDPYGDKNKPGYPNYYGKNASYDWPGYNNGFKNFNNAYWVTTCRYTVPAVTDSMVDDLQLERGFTMNTKGAATMDVWRDYKSGYLGHSWYAFSKGSGLDTCFAEWRLPIKANGSYELLAYIPGASSTDAVYRVVHANGNNYVHINQSANIGKWVSLGTFYFLKGSTGYVRLGDGSTEGGRTISFDAIKWRYLGDPNGTEAGSANAPSAFQLEQNYPNPFNPNTTIRYSITQPGPVTLSVYDVSGRMVAELVNGMKEAGNYSVSFSGDNLGSGIYMCRLTANGQSQIKKLTLLK